MLVDAGWVGLEVPEQFGGAGATFAEAAVVCEEIGRAASATSYLGSAVLAVGTLNALQPSDTRDSLLVERGVGGAARVTVALEPYDFVPDAEGADRILIVTGRGVVVTEDGRRRRGPYSTRRAGWPPCHRAPRSPSCCRSPAIPTIAVQRLHDRAAAAIACDSLGL